MRKSKAGRPRIGHTLEPDAWCSWEAGRLHLKLDEILDKLKADGHRMSPACSDKVDALLLTLWERRAAEDLTGYRDTLAEIGKAAIEDHESQKAGTVEKPAPRNEKPKKPPRMPSKV